MTPEDMQALVDDLYRLCATDIDRALQLYVHDDFVIEEAQDLPMAGIYRGKAGLKSLYADVFSMIELAGLERSCFMTGDRCCAYKVVFQLADPALAPVELLEFFRFKDGKVIEMRPYYFSPAAFTRAVARTGA